MNLLSWAHPQAFFLIVPLCAIWIGLALYARARRRQAAAKFVAQAMMPRILPRESSGRFWAKTILLGLAFVFGILALARPRFGVYYEDIRARGSDIYVAIDVSRSMLADDVPPSRLGRAKADVQTLLNRLHGERIGLIAFAGVAVVKCPLTTDYNFFRLTLNELSPNSVPRGGTAIGDAIRKALEVMPKMADRDQALLLITDGDDQNSYPLDAASTAAERSVTIFTVGLGDTAQGSRIPVGESAKHFLEYKGEDVWSKMDEQLLKDIALKTNGAYIPARTRQYDLGELYADHLSKLRGAEGGERKEQRLLEQYQWFLGLAILCVLADLFIRMYEPRPAFKAARAAAPSAGKTTQKGAGEMKLPSTPAARPTAEAKPSPPALQGETKVAPLLILLAALPLISLRAGEERELVRQGLELYKKDDFDGAREKFNKAAEDEAKQQEREHTALIAFDLACAYHRKGDTEHAKEQYLRAGLTRDKSIAAAADFNLGCMSSETARTLAGEHPENVPPEKRQQILDKLKEAAGSFRSCLEVQPQHPQARKNIELIRTWIKVYTDKWREIDKQKLREKSNLFEFLQYIIGSERMLRAAVQELKETSTLDVLFEHREAQKELRDEIEPLKDKIAAALKSPPQAPPGPNAPPSAGPNEKEIAEGIKLLSGWADTAAAKMRAAESELDSRQPKKAADEQKLAIAELERIWEALIPFRPLLAHDLAAETAIVHELKPEAPDGDKSESLIGKAFDWLKDKLQANPPAPKPAQPAPSAPKLELDSKAGEELAELQETTSHRTDLLKAKAQAELEQVEKMPPPQAQAKPPGPTDPNAPKQPAPPDPEKIKAGLRKAIELAPKAVEHMNAAARQLRKGDRAAATPEAEEAKKILEEIMKAQPQDEQKKQDQDKKDQQKKDQDKDKKDQDKKDQDKKDQDKKDQDKKEQDKKDQEKQKDEKNGEKEKQPMSKEQAEALLRKVREREQKHRKDQEERALIMGGNAPVEKDW